MRKDILLSIIIPVFNTELYLEECLESILNQGLNSYEILIINDGSTDSSKDIILEYTDRYPFIKYFEQENSGQGTARNVGIDNSIGKYIYFMDSDDFLAQGKLKEMLTNIIELDYELLFFEGESFLHENPDKLITDFNYKKKNNYGQFDTGEELLVAFSMNNELIISPCLYITKASVIKNNKLYFPEKIKHEDEFFTVTLLLYAKKCSHMNETVFLRRIRNNSTMTNTNKIPSFIGYSKVLYYFDDIYEKFPFSSEKGKQAYKRKMQQLTKAAYRAYSQIEEKSKVKDASEELNTFGKKYSYFGITTFAYKLLTNNKTMLKYYTSIVKYIKK